jgi:hypothetical protein
METVIVILDPKEIERMIVAQTLFIREFAR